MDPVSWRKAKEMPGVTATAMNQSVIQAYFFNMKRKPFADPRVRRALNLAADRHVLVDVGKDTAPIQGVGCCNRLYDWPTTRAEMVKLAAMQKAPMPATEQAKQAVSR